MGDGEVRALPEDVVGGTFNSTMGVVSIVSRGLCGVVKYCVLRNFGCLAILSNIMK